MKNIEIVSLAQKHVEKHFTSAIFYAIIKMLVPPRWNAEAPFFFYMNANE